VHTISYRDGLGTRGYQERRSFLLAGALVGLLAATACGQEEKAAKPAAPTEFAYVLSNGYGLDDKMPTDRKVFENLLVNMKKSGFNTIHCVHRDWRVELCRKHGVKMMIDVLAWKEGALTDIRRPEQRDAVKKICEASRKDDAIWGYNLWNESLSFFGNPDDKDIDAYVAMLKEWDPTHPVWMGTRTVTYANSPKSRPGVHGYYDYAWQRGFQWHFADLAWYHKYVPSQDGFIGRWEQGSDYERNAFSLNTSIAFGTKVTIWFIGGPFDKDGNIDKKHRFHHLVQLGQDTMKLYPEIGKIGRPSEVYSTATTKTHDNKDRSEKDRAANKGVPWALTPFPEGFWFTIHEGESLAGFFRYPEGEDAVFVANNNAFAKQKVIFSLHENARNDKTRIELFDRQTGRWVELKANKDRHSFDLQPGGGELLRIHERKAIALPKKEQK